MVLGCKMDNKKDSWVYWVGGLTVAVLFMGIRKRLPVETILSTAAKLVIDFEGFRSKPYWDISRYSWGYGTAAPGRNGTITREKAYTDLYSYLKTDYYKLSKLITVPLTANQWASLLSFSYNLGFGNADNLVKNINSKNWSALKKQWVLYINADGQPDPDLLVRRQKELQNFFM